MKNFRWLCWEHVAIATGGRENNTEYKQFESVKVISCISERLANHLAISVQYVKRGPGILTKREMDLVT
jgi:hypothetical protein